ncbi:MULTISPECIES: hypothetical protein [unclassified Streptomyces]
MASGSGPELDVLSKDVDAYIEPGEGVAPPLGDDGNNKGGS